MEKYEVRTFTFEQLKGKIKVPSFQRGLVWSQKKKEEFIKTLKKGMPIGVLLLSEADVPDKYLVIDGLQRFSTMLEYSKNYFEYIDASEIGDSAISSILNADMQSCVAFDGMTPEAKQAIRDQIRKIFVDCINHSQGQNKNEIAKGIAKKLCEQVSIIHEESRYEIHDAAYVIVERFVESSNINEVKIPVIIFKGEKTELADIFQKLNQEGVKLTKYDVFSATWVGQTVTVNNDSAFIDYVINKYKQAQDKSGLEIEEFDEDKMHQDGELTVFEYAFALGKALMEKCTMLFPSTDETKVDSIGFLLLAELMGVSYSQMADLATVMMKYKERVNFKDLKDKILECAGLIEEALGKTIQAPTKSKQSLECHSELQIASYIIVMFKLKYDMTPEEGIKARQGTSSKIASMKRYLYKHYLCDILRGYWAGSGNSKLEQIIKDIDTCRYLLDVGKDNFRQTVTDWIDSSNNKATQNSVTTETKLFLNILLRKKGNDTTGTYYDIEHCVPQKTLKDHFINRGIEVPISTVSNLVYIPVKDNRRKQDKTYYQRQQQDTATYTLNHEALCQLVYPEHQELMFVESNDTLTKDNYKAFLEIRKNKLIEEIMSCVYTD